MLSCGSWVRIPTGVQKLKQTIMATYRSYEELEGKTLQFGDIVKFRLGNKTVPYNVHDGFLNTPEPPNSKIFDELDLLRFDFASAYYGYKTINGSWPECKKGDYKALTRLVLALFKKCEEFNATQNTSKEPIKEKVEEEPYEVGDFVKITSIYDPTNCPSGLTKAMVDIYGGQWCRIKAISSTEVNRCWMSLESTDGIPISYLWTKEMFSEHRKVLIESPYKKDILVDASKSSDFSFTKANIPESCPYHPYVIDQAIEQRSRIRQITLKEAFKDVISKDVSDWFVWSNSSQGVPYWLNIFNNPSFIPKDYTPKYYKELSSARNETIEEVEEPTSGRPFTIPLSYEEVKLSLKKPTCKF